MLTQMEFFSGIFVACTNLMDWIDQAALRRFDIKAKFDFLNSTQAWELLCRYCAADGRAEPSLELRSRLSRLANLTPGDFAVVARRTRFEGLESVSDRLEALESESALKNGGKHPIGFV
jgi:transitional endoplasmic reticulum ATPase